MSELSISWLPYAVFIPFIGSAVTSLLFRFLRQRIGWIASIFPLVLFIYFIGFIGDVRTFGAEVKWAWVPFLDVGLTFSLNGLSLLMSLLITGMGFLVILYTQYYFSIRENLGKFYSYMLLFIGAMLGVVTSDNLIGLYIFWELTSVSSFLLIGFWHTSEASRQGALKALMVTVLGGFALLVSFLLLYAWGGSFDISELLAFKEVHGHGGLYVAIALLFFIGTWTKSAQVPFHFWLPGAMAAPTPVSAYLHSATMVKAGIFLTAKFALLLGGTPFWYYSIATVGAMTVLIGAMLALKQTDLKALLAFSTVSQLGLIIPMFGMGTALSSWAGTAHILNHALFKGALFLLIGVIDHQTGTRDINRLQGLGKRMPLTATLVIVAALSMAGVWPLNGFVSKELIFEALLNPPFGTNAWTIVLLVITALGSVLTTVYCLVLIHRINFGRTDDEDVRASGEPSLSMLISPIILVAFVILLGVYPALTQGTIIDHAAGAVAGEPVNGVTHFIPPLNAPFIISFLVLLIGFIAYVNFDRLRYGLDRINPRVHSNMVYDAILGGLEKISKRLLEIHMTGFLRDYIVYILVSVVLAVGYVLVSSGVFRSMTPDFSPAGIHEVIVLALISISAFAVAKSKSRLVAIASLGMVGIMMTLLYVLLRAPDLALTQFMVDAIGIVLILLAFRRLPPFWPENPVKNKKRIDLVIAVTSGVFVSVMALVANGHRFFPSISSYFVENSLTLGGGTNIVNVILVDFRGFDTLGEITVLALAGLSVFAIVRLRHGRKRP